MQTLTIQQVAQQTKLSVHTLRYYERNDCQIPSIAAAVDRAIRQKTLPELSF